MVKIPPVIVIFPGFQPAPPLTRHLSILGFPFIYFFSFSVSHPQRDANTLPSPLLFCAADAKPRRAAAARGSRWVELLGGRS